MRDLQAGLGPLDLAARSAFPPTPSYRYERGVDPHTRGGGRAARARPHRRDGRRPGRRPRFASVGGDVPWKREIVISSGFVRERLGFDIPAAEMKAALESLELNVAREEAAPGRAQAGPSRSRAGATISTGRSTWWRRSCGSTGPSVSRPHAWRRSASRPRTIPLVGFNRRATDYLVGHDFHECVEPDPSRRPGS